MDLEDSSTPETTHVNPDQSSDEDSVSSINPEWLASFSDSDGGEQEPEPASNQWNVEKSVDAARMFKLRRGLGQLDHFHQQKEQDLLTTSEQLKVCRQHMEELLEQRERLEEDMRSQTQAENSAAVFRQRAQHRRLCAELQNEEELETQLKATIHKCQLELCEVEVEQAKISSLRQEVQEEEHAFNLQKQQRATRRLQQERQASRHRQNKSQQTALKLNPQKSDSKEEKKMTNTNSGRLIRETLRRARQEEADRQQQSRELLENRRQAVKALQSNISAMHSRVRAHRQRPKRVDHEQSRATEPELEKAHKHWHIKEKQQSKVLPMGSKAGLLEESQQHLKKMKEPFQAVKKAPEKDRSRDRHLDSRSSFLPQPPNQPSTLRQIPHAQPQHKEQSDSEDSSDPEEQQEDVAGDLEQPEFSGMWTHNYKEVNKHPVLVQTQALQDRHVTPSETFNVSAKKVPNKETREPPFISKPELVKFKDFEVRQVYSKKITLTNVSYSTNVCRFVGVSAPLNDFLSVRFEPPGALSTGMSCELEVIFEPQVNEDLEGQIHLASATGPFYVPVRCSTKKCQMEVDCHCLDFGSHLVGLTVMRSITLTNRGALASLFRLDMSDSVCLENSFTPLTPCAPAITRQEASSGVSMSDKEMKQESGVEHSEFQEKTEPQPAAVCATGTDQLPSDSSSYPADSSYSPDSSHSNDDTTCDVHFGSVTEGQIEPFQSIKLDVIFKPTIPGDTKLTFYIHFSDSSSPPIAVQVKAVALDVPVWVSQRTIDLKICLWDQSYHHWLCVHSRATTALKLKFKVCPELRKHIKVVPKTGFVQAQSSFKALLKFQPRASLPEDTDGFFDRDTGVLEAPVEVHAAEQVLQFTVSAVLTSSDLTLDPSVLDFGSCSLLHATRSSVRLTNLSLLPQTFGFINVPEFINVQPNDGFGTLLPQENLDIDLIFRPKSAKVYNFQLYCKTGLNRDLVLVCRGVGVRPPLELSYSAVQFGAAAFGDSSSALVHIINTERPMTPAQPRLFSLHLPQQSDISVSPSTGCLMPGQHCVVQLTFRPTLRESELQQESSRTLTEAEAVAESSERQLKMMSKVMSESCQHLNQLPEQLTVACCVSDPLPQSAQEAPPSWSPINTLYLKLQCPVIQPPLAASGGNTVDFHHVIVGERAIEKCVVQNVSEESLHLCSSVLAVTGPFSVLNALRPLRPGQSLPLQLAFSPTQARQYQERLKLSSPRGALWLTLCGEGVVPDVTCSPSSTELDFGHVLIQDTSSHTLQLQNHSALEVNFKAVLSSQTLPTLQGGHQCASRGQSVPLKLKSPLPLSGNTPGSVFSVVPALGRLAPGQSQDVRVSFQPQQEYEFYRDHLTVELSNQSSVCNMDLFGAACFHSMFVSGGDPLPGFNWPGTEEEPIPVLVTLKAYSSREQWSPAIRELELGFVHSTLSSKKSANFFLDNLGPAQQQGFSVEPSKGAVKPGSNRTLTITWTPQSGYKPLEVVQSCVSLMLKGDTDTVYSVTLMALVTSDP